MKKSVWKSIWSIVAGFLVVVILSTLTDAVMEQLHIYPTIGNGVLAPWMLGVALAYRVVYTVLGGYVTARFAPQNTMKYVKILAILGTIAGILGVVAGWNLSAHWYPIAIAITAYPSVWWGGKLFVNSQKKK